MQFVEVRVGHQGGGEMSWCTIESDPGMVFLSAVDSRAFPATVLILGFS